MGDWVKTIARKPFHVWRALTARYLACKTDELIRSLYPEEGAGKRFFFALCYLFTGPTCGSHQLRASKRAALPGKQRPDERASLRTIQTRGSTSSGQLNMVRLRAVKDVPQHAARGAPQPFRVARPASGAFLVKSNPNPLKLCR